MVVLPLLYVTILLSQVCPSMSSTSTKSPVDPATSLPTTTTTTQAPGIVDSTTDASTVTVVTTVVTTATTPAAPVLGGDCAGKPTEWCNDGIVGVAECNTDKCRCVLGHFMAAPTKCLPESDLKPLNLTISDISSVSLKITWTLADSLSALSIISTVEAKHTDPSLTKSCQVTGRTAQCIGLTPGNEYTVKVTNTFTDANVVESDSKLQAIDPAQPGAITINTSDLTAPDVTLKWTASVGLVEYYQVTLTGPSVKPAVNVNITEIILLTLEPGITYNIKIVAHSNGRPSSELVTSFTTDSTVPNPPTNVTVVPSTTDTTVHLGWIAPATPNGAIQGYKICTHKKVYVDLPYTADGCVNTTGVVTTYQHSQLSPGVHYKFMVFTRNDKFISDTSGDIEERTSEAVPGTIDQLSVVPDDDNFNVTWQRPVTPNGDIITYRVDWERANNSCTVFLKSNQSADNLNNTCNANSIDIERNQKEMAYTITDLQPNTLYTVKVTAYTTVGAGEAKFKNLNSSVVKPDKVTNITTEVLNATSVKVSWVIPSVNPGPVTYKVMAVDMVLGQPAPNCTVIGYNSSSCIVTDLEEYWVYGFKVDACSVAGCSQVSSTQNTTTQDAEPDAPSFNEVTLFDQSNCDATKVLLKWSEPNLRLRNSKISQYIITMLRQGGQKTYDVSNPIPYNSSNREFTGVFMELNANTSYNWKIHAVSSTGKTGIQSQAKAFTTKTCAPPPFDEQKHGKIESDVTKTTTSTVTLKMSPVFFSDTSQGQIQESGFIVAFKEDTLESMKDTQRTWDESRDKGFMLPYKIKLSRPYTYDNTVIGKDACTDPQDKGTYCNGHLPAASSIYVIGYICTKAGSQCTTTQAYGPFSTKQKPVPEGSDNTALLAVVFVLLILIIGIIVVVGVLWKMKIIDPTEWWNKNAGSDSEDIPVSPIYEIKKNRPIVVSKFESVLEDLHKDTNLQLSDQYEDITKLSQQISENSSTDASNLEPNKAKNRWVNILPFDHSRVKLQPIDDDEPESDYVNANYMPGFNHHREYIATQGPLPGTIDDFWRMVWEHNVMVIVMLTQCKEGNRVKCEKYWPDEIREPKQYGDVVVNPVSISQLDKHNISIFEVSINNQSRQVIHFHYLDFPDFSANVEFDHFINFVKTVRSHVPHTMSGPIVCHCSAGVGRTGTFIAVDRLYQFLYSKDFSMEAEIDIFGIVLSLRENRVLMVQTESQFVMIHDCFQQMLEEKKEKLLMTDSEENMYANEGFEATADGKNPYPDVLYENVSTSLMKTDL